ncbi:MAG: hypothetical protein K0S33_230 [Bacteroidetes bacterium]|jgi:uncharacterized protein YndB with AHSA1/START domain|nr:hypothetical protein [Bacteroidota bacterium]
MSKKKAKSSVKKDDKKHKKAAKTKSNSKAEKKSSAKASKNKIKTEATKKKIAPAKNKKAIVKPVKKSKPAPKKVPIAIGTKKAVAKKIVVKAKSKKASKPAPKKVVAKKAVKKPAPKKVAAKKQVLKKIAKKTSRPGVTKKAAPAKAKKIAPTKTVVKKVSKPAPKPVPVKTAKVVAPKAPVTKAKPEVSKPAKVQAPAKKPEAPKTITTTTVLPQKPLIIDKAPEKPIKEPAGKFELEYVIHTSTAILFEFLTSPSGLSEWFCDDVNIRNEIYTFLWDGTQQQARLIKLYEEKLVRFQWVDRLDDAFFEFRIDRDDLTNDISLIVTDFADNESERQSSKLLWDSQIDKLLHVLGSHF